MKTLLLKFDGPLQSWGTDSHFETRNTDLYPSKSAIIGMIAAGFGIRRDDDYGLSKLKEIKFAVRIDQSGRLLRDYHIARKLKPNGDFDRNYVTNRYYLEDAIFMVGITHDDDEFVKEIENALKNPYFQIYLGRRACPPTANLIIGIQDENIIDLLQTFPRQAKGWYRKEHTATVDIYLDSILNKELRSTPRRDNVISFSQKDRKFQHRNESRLSVTVPDGNGGNISNAYDAFSDI